MTIFGKFTTGLAVVVLLFIATTIRGQERSPQPFSSSYARMMARKMGADYEFRAPDTVQTGGVESIDLVIKTGLSPAELERFTNEVTRLNGGKKIDPCLEARLDLIETDGITVKAMAHEHQRLMPYGRNQWTWQIKGRKPGEYLLSLTLSLCADENNHEPLATPIAFNRRIKVVGEPLLDPVSKSSVFLGGLVLIAAGLLLAGVFFLRRHRCQGRYEIHPGAGEKVFVSYSKHDRKRVEPVIEHLKQAGHELWIDRHAIESASSWREEIVEALTNSRYMLFFASNKSYRSTNVGKELSIAADENLIIIPVLLENCEAVGAGKFVVAGLQRVDARSKPARAVASELSVLLNRGINNFLNVSREDALEGGKESHFSVPS